jgi:hypothetical protein
MKNIKILLFIVTQVFILLSCSSDDTSANIEKSQLTEYSINDLIDMSQSKFGFVQPDGSISEFYGDFECTSPDESSFDLNVGCGRSGDIISVIMRKNSAKENCFDVILKKGGMYYGVPATSDKKIGEFIIVSKDEIKGSIKLCLEADASCCGEVGENFTLKKIISNDASSEKKSVLKPYIDYLELTKQAANSHDKFEDDAGLISFLLPKGDFIISNDNSLKSEKLSSIVKVLFSETSQMDSPDAIWEKSDLSKAIKQGIDVTYFAEKKDWVVVSGFNKAGNIVYKKGFYFKPENNYAGENGRNTQPWCQTVVIELEYPNQKKGQFDRIISDLMKSMKVNFYAIIENY